MKRNETSQGLTMHCKCYFSHMIWVTYNPVLSCHFQKINKLRITYPIMIKGELNRIGTKFILRRPDLGLDLFYELSEKVITDYYGLFKYHIYKTIPESFEYYQVIELRYINEDEFFLYTSFIYNNNIYLSEKDIKENINLSRNLYSNILKSLRDLDAMRILATFTLINSDIELIYDVIRNMKLVHKYAHIIGDEIDYNGEIINKDYIIKINDFHNKSIIKSLATVNRCLIRKASTIKSCIIEIFFKNEEKNLLPFSLNKILMNIYEYGNKSSMYVLYIFNTIQEKKDLKSFSEKKNRELKVFKNIIENFKKKKSVKKKNKHQE